MPLALSERSQSSISIVESRDNRAHHAGRLDAYRATANRLRDEIDATEHAASFVNFVPGRRGSARGSMMASSIHTQFVYSADFATEVVKGADGRNWSGHGTLPGLHSVQHSEMIEAQQYRSRLEAAYASDEKPPWLRERLARQTTSALYSTAAVRKRLGGGGPASALDYAKAAAAEAEVKQEVQAMVARAMRAVEGRYDRKPSIFDPRKI